MSTPAPCGLCEAVPDPSFDAEWQMLIREQAQVLGAMLQRLLGATQRPRSRTTTARLQTLAAEAERLFTRQAQQHLVLERDLGQLRAMVTDLSPAPATLTQRVLTMARAIAVLHGNLTAARRWVATLTTDAT